MTKKEKIKKMAKNVKKKGAGGDRPGSGRPKEYTEETKQTGFAVPISYRESFIKYCRLFLDPLKIKK